jgi:nucleoside-diphosphate-sugar epimerase
MGNSFRAVHEDARLGEVKHAYCTIDKSIKLLEYRTKYSLRDGLSKIAKWEKKDSALRTNGYSSVGDSEGCAPRDWNEKLL